MHQYTPGYLPPKLREQLLAYIGGLHPLWEMRYSTLREPPNGQPQRQLLRPVYWLGNWQFACLDYYRPPKGIKDRCVQAEPFPPVIDKIRLDMERRIRAAFSPRDVPKGWHFNTCLINFYGEKLEGGRWVDVARVGEHRDFEPGPVGSLSLGARAMFQFVSSQRIGERDGPRLSQWLDDGSLQVFGGRQFKDLFLHRVQRVARSTQTLGPEISDYRTRRINLTFRFVPPEHVTPYRHLGGQAKADIQTYVHTLAEHSPFFAQALAGENVR
jgi:alkylated DNA repair dioxygenase AlkB